MIILKIVFEYIGCYFMKSTELSHIERITHNAPAVAALAVPGASRDGATFARFG
jgi:hypothetical protein